MTGSIESLASPRPLGARDVASRPGPAPALQATPAGRVTGLVAWYVAAVALAGTAVLVQAGHELWVRPVAPEWLVLAGLTLVAGRFSIHLPKVPVTISVAEVFVFLMLIAYGPAAAAITLAADGLLLSLAQRPRRLHRMLFNTFEPAVSIWLAGQTFFALAGVTPASGLSFEASRLIGPVFAMATVYFLSNTWLAALGVAAETGGSPGSLWLHHFARVSLPCFAEASLAALIMHSTSRIELAALGLAIPLLVVSYLTFRTSTDRVEDAERHVAEVNRLYVSTIEALAIAVDAKDQVTHGHIRRVQRYSVRLAQSLGVSEGPELKAIGAASLLHDIGKLAVPDHLLNKPGPLTPWEFERIQQHAVAGANILSVVEFPYPVVPIVLHHHENWDGTGYPTGLAGSAIPLCARVLSVVDCYDALTSDRPYRRRLSEGQAVEILRARRGTMYDPRVVDEFIRLLPSLQAAEAGAPSAEPPGAEWQVPASLVSGAAQGSRRSRRWHAEAIGLASLWPMLSDEVTRSVQGGLAVLYVPTQIGDDLVADLTSANAPPALINRVISLGQGASGWAASAGDVVPVADAYLDLGTVADELGLRSCFAAPLVRDSTLLGVLTVYSTGNLAPREIALLKTLAAGLAAQADSARPAPLRPPATADPTQTNPRVLSDRF